MFAAPKTDTEVQKIIADGVSVKTQADTKYCIRIWNEWVENRVDEQLVMERTGHRSIDGICSYKRTADFQRENISDILSIKTSGYRVHALADGIKTSKSNEERSTWNV